VLSVDPPVDRRDVDWRTEVIQADATRVSAEAREECARIPASERPVCRVRANELVMMEEAGEAAEEKLAADAEVD